MTTPATPAVPIDAQTLEAIKERYAGTDAGEGSNRKRCHYCGEPVEVDLVAYCEGCECWEQVGDPAVLALLDAYEALVERIRGIEVQTTVEQHHIAKDAVEALATVTVSSVALTVAELLTVAATLANEVTPSLLTDASALAALKAEVGEQ